MLKCVLFIFDRFKKSPWLGWLSFIVFTVIFILLILHLSYKEDITDFLPLDEQNQTALTIYQDISGANKIFGIISLKGDKTDLNELVEATDLFVDNVENLDSLHYLNGIMKEIDMDNIQEITDFVYENIPYFLEGSDYQRIDSLLSIPNYIESKLSEDKQMLMFPTSSMVGNNIARDPLDLFSPITYRLQQGGLGINFDTYDGHILSPDGTRAIVILESEFGAQESENNAKLVSLLNKSRDLTEQSNSKIEIHIIGGPVIAVGNASQIKTDSILAVCISGVLILALLIYVFRNIWNILLIVISIGWGWLFAMAAISLHYDSISLIVLGITSVILGIAVNYPLHLIDHIKEHPNPRSALKEIVSPLVVGNITTVGAFLCLVPLDSPALHDLGLFSSFLLIGTILFVLIFLPHVIQTNGYKENRGKENLLAKFTNLKLENSKYLVWVVLILSIVFAVFSFKTEFDSDIRNINYMTPEQMEDMRYFQSLVTSEQDNEELFVVIFGDTWNEALQENERLQPILKNLQSQGLAKTQNKSTSFLISEEAQLAKLQNWENFRKKYGTVFNLRLKNEGVKQGFNPEAFNNFYDILNDNYSPLDFEHYKGFINTVFNGTLSENNKSGKKTIVQTLNIKSENVDKVKSELSKHEFGGMFFDVKSMNSSIANSLSDDFNYIGFACGAIVFIFLWISLGSIELAIISFTPMAISWIWILGFMGMTGIKFNIVNIILATFIFGQGDDYTIFITEGLTFEFAYRKKILASYKNSIIVSALIMFFGIGTLLFAKHPAMRSLGEVTVIGMVSVVLMAYLFPPLIFNWLIRKNGKLRLHPITLMSFFKNKYKREVVLNSLKMINSVETAIPWVMGRYLYKGRDIELKARRILRVLERSKNQIENQNKEFFYVKDFSGEGELALALALLYPASKVYCKCYAEDSSEILKGCIEDFVANIVVADEIYEQNNCFVLTKKDSSLPENNKSIIIYT